MRSRPRPREGWMWWLSNTAFHHAAVVRCQDCRFWDQLPGADRSVGLCRRDSPVAWDPEAEGYGVWPLTENWDGCGDGRPPDPEPPGPTEAR